MRRKVVRKTKPSAAQDDKKLQAALKKLNVQPIPGVEEVNMFREDGNVLHFTTPKGTFSLDSIFHSLPCTRPRRLFSLSHTPVLSDQVIEGINLALLFLNSSCRGDGQYICDLRRRARQGAHRARPWHSQPARP